MYQIISNIARKFFSDAQVFKIGFNISPMYRRSTGRVIEVSEDLLKVKIKIPISWKNKNYVGTIFGGSLYSATDPVYMIQLIHILGSDYVIWDKAAEIKYRKPAKKSAYAEFIFSEKEIENIKKEVAEKKEIDLVKDLQITDGKDETYCELKKIIYIADKAYYKEKKKKLQS